MGTDPPRPGRGRPAVRGWVLAAAMVVAVVAGGGGYLVGRAGQGGEEHNDVDVGFLQDMSFHHQQGIEMAMLVLNGDPGAEAKGFALDVLRVQSRERGHMDAILERWGVPYDGDPQRPAMAWMGMGMEGPARGMLGLATVDQMDALAQTTGPALDELFLHLMRQHHQGGLHMAREAQELAASEEVAQLAELMVRVQTSEVEDYTRALQLMGVE